MIYNPNTDDVFSCSDNSNATPRRIILRRLLVFPMALVLVAGIACAGTTASPTTDTPPSFTMEFPGDFTVTKDGRPPEGRSYFPLMQNDVALGGYYSGTAYADTNFRSMSVAASETLAKDGDEDCADFDGYRMCRGDEGVGDATINAIPFQYAAMQDAAVGNRLEARKYWTIRDGRRYEVLLTLSYTDASNYTPGTVKEFDRKGCWEKLLSILQTFSFSTK